MAKGNSSNLKLKMGNVILALIWFLIWMMCHPVSCTFNIRNVFRLCIFPIFTHLWYGEIRVLQTCYCIFACSLSLKIISNYPLRNALQIGRGNFQVCYLFPLCSSDYTCYKLQKGKWMGGVLWYHRVLTDCTHLKKGYIIWQFL